MDKIKCPHCGKQVELSEAIVHELSEQVRDEEAKKLKAQFEEEKAKEKAASEKKLREEFERENKQKSKELEDLKRKEHLLAEKLAQEQEEREKNEEKIREQTLKEASEKSRLDKLEYEKKLSDMQKALEDAQRKGKQGSQQLQGEVLELDLEEKLKSTFPNDEFIPVAKGKEGGDLIQNVRNKFGKVGSVIIWEFKRTKNWDKKWLPKLREDARASNANEAIVVTEVMPDSITVYEKIDGVWVTNLKYALHLAKILREMGLRIAIAKSGAQHDDESLKKIHDYILSEEFRHKIEKEVERLNSSLKLLEDRHKADDKYYRLQRQNLESLTDNTSQIYFDLQKRIPSLPSVAGLEPEIITGDDEDENQTLF